MDKKLTALILLAAVLVSLCGCGSLFDTEYVSVEDYVPSAQDAPSDEERVTVRNINELKQAIRNIVAAGESESSIFFDAAYDGDATEDMASACWQVRTQDALCAYYVENIAYELNKIVAYYEVRVYVSYSDVWQEAGSIVQMQYSTGLEDALRTALLEGDTKLVVLIGRSSYSASEMESLVQRAYRRYPASAPREPGVNVNMFSGTGMQRLYEINISYGYSATELAIRQKAMAELDPFADLDLDSLDKAHRALEACSYLMENCEYAAEGQPNDIYSALIGGYSGSEGIALAYVELCRRLDVNCQIVYGQRNWQDYCWNIIEIDGESYHVDVNDCSALGLQGGFLLKDEQIWGDHRWDVSAYPPCTGSLSYEALEQ